MSEAAKFIGSGAISGDRSPKPATAQTEAHNKGMLSKLPFEDRTSFDLAERGFIASINPMTITRESDGKAVFDLEGVNSFLREEAPATANPSQWRQAQLNALNHGLFEVVDGIYQVRSFDAANMTLIRGEKGWVLIDPLTCAETAKAALALANKHLGERPVTAIIITHSHGDHFGGILGVVDPADVASGKVPLIAPEHFVAESLSENVLAGTVMQRRATYMYGNLLPSSPQGFLTIGLGAGVAMGSFGFLVPNDLICKTGETRVLDGIEIEFQMTPGTEAPAEMVFYFPQFKALCMSEITSAHLHNVYTPRGAQIRDSLAWSRQIQESIDLFGDRLELEFASHHWPIWGRDAVVDYLQKQRDLYKYIHDQSLRLANLGYTKEEIAETIKLPDSLAQEFYNRDYYGTVKHNSKAVYVKYLGYFNGNPATLDALPPVEAGKRYVKFMGGADNLLANAKASFEEGEYRWVAEVLNHLVMAEPENEAAKMLLADALEQLGYQAESGPWRNFYLTGAYELREGVPESSPSQISEGVATGMPLDNLFDAFAMRLDGPKAAGRHYRFKLSFTDLGKTYRWELVNGVLHAWADRDTDNPTAHLTLSTADFKRMMFGLVSASDLKAEGRLMIDGNAQAFSELASFFVSFNPRFPIMTPRPSL